MMEDADDDPNEELTVVRLTPCTKDADLTVRFLALRKTGEVLTLSSHDDNAPVHQYRCPDCDEQYITVAPRDSENCSCGGYDVYELDEVDPLDENVDELLDQIDPPDGSPSDINPEADALRELVKRREEELRLAIEESALDEDDRASRHPLAAKRQAHRMMSDLGLGSFNEARWTAYMKQLRERAGFYQQRAVEAQEQARALSPQVMPAPKHRFGEAVLLNESDPRSRS